MDNAKSSGPHETDTSSLDILLIDKDVDFPDGGVHAWLVVFGAMMGLIPAFGLLNSLGAIQAYISEHQLASAKTSTISWIFSLNIAVEFGSCVFAGAYFDRNGARLMQIVGSLMTLGGMFATANCTTVWQFVLAFGLVTGCGCGILMTVLIACVATWFKEKRGIANSFASLGGSIGGIVFPLVLRKLFSSVGFPWAIRILTFILLVCLVISVILCRERIKPQCRPFQSRTEMIRYYSSRSFDARYLLDWKFLFMSLGCAMAEGTLTAAATYYPSYAIFMGNSETTSYTLITIVNASGIVGRCSGFIADHWIGKFSVLIISMVLIAVLNLVMWLPFGKHIGVLYGYSVAYGIVVSSILSLTPVAVGQVSEIKDFGKRYSTMYVVVAILTLPILPVGGVIIGDGKSETRYNWFIVYSSLLSVLGAVFYAISRWFCVGFRKVKF